MDTNKKVLQSRDYNRLFCKHFLSGISFITEKLFDILDIWLTVMINIENHDEI